RRQTPTQAAQTFCIEAQGVSDFGDSRRGLHRFPAPPMRKEDPENWFQRGMTNAQEDRR
ncbi:hypothetical protein IWW36_003504, partial [Coemansia brasiliensis]